MRVALDCETVTHTDRDDVLRLLLLISEGRHEWVGPLPKAGPAQQILDGMAGAQELVEASFVAAQAYSTGSDRLDIALSGSDVAQGSSTDYAGTLAEARDYLRTPLLILVENEIGDGAFVLAHLRVVDEELATRIDEGHATFYQGGGKTELIKLAPLKAASNSVNGRFPRVVVIADSDARHPTDPGEASADLRRAARRSSVICHILRKRAQENYLSDRALDDYATVAPTRRAAVEAIKSLEGQQRDFYPMKKGLKQQLTAQEAVLYAGVDCGPLREPGLSGLPARTEAYLAGLGAIDLSSRGAIEEFQELARTIWERL